MGKMIKPMVANILDQMQKLGPMRLKLFLKWLSTKLKIDLYQSQNKDRLELALTSYFESLSIKNALCEYNIIIVEIDWWIDLNDQRLNYFI